jgi:hypothetical protein
LEVVAATTTYDVFTTSKELSNEIESQIIADGISKAVIARLTPAGSRSKQKPALHRL